MTFGEVGQPQRVVSPLRAMRCGTFKGTAMTKEEEDAADLANLERRFLAHLTVPSPGITVPKKRISSPPPSVTIQVAGFLIEISSVSARRSLRTTGGKSRSRSRRRPNNARKG